MAPKSKAMFEVCLPASTSNLGPGFDCFGLALKLYLRVRCAVVANAKEPCRVRTTGASDNRALPRNASNLIYRAMAFAARRESVSLPPVELVAHNEIPLASGLGSSAAAIVAGIKLSALVTGTELPDLDFVALAAGHAVPAVRVERADALHAVLADALRSSGPMLVEVEVA